MAFAKARNGGSTAMRSILFAHRWLGVVLGLVMTVWCLSGFVMLYVDYPRLLPAERLQGLAPLDLSACCTAPAGLAEGAEWAAARIEMRDGNPVLRLRPASDPGRLRNAEQARAMPLLTDLNTGRQPEALEPERVRMLAQNFAERIGVQGDAGQPEQIIQDQWTVQNARRHQPLYRVPFDDDAGTVIYIAAASGEVVQQTTAHERFWGWLGAVPHWLYPTLLRQDTALWAQVVIWLSLAGCFLTITGLVVGIQRLRRRDGSLSIPYRGLWRWHHITGLTAGVLTLTWVLSGLLSMNPWGLLDSTAGGLWRARLAGGISGADIARMLAIAPTLPLPPDTVEMEATPLDGRLYLTIRTGNGIQQRFDAQGHAAPLQQTDLAAALAGLGPVAELALMQGPDDYYYSHKFPIRLPVYRAILADADQTRLYIDAESGQLLRAVDGPARAFRWWQDGLHSLDFAWMRARPLWDLIILPLLAAVTLVCATGTWMGIRRLRRDLRSRRRK